MANQAIDDDDYASDSILGVESDDDSHFDDSPVDGYFDERPHPSDVFVENPSLPAKGGAKAREAAEQRAGSSTMTASPSRHLSAAVVSPRSNVWQVEEPTATFTEAPPPNYETATANRPSTQTSPEPSIRSPIHTSYGSLPNSVGQNSGAFVQTGQQWPFGNQGNPFYPGFPFGPSGNHFATSDSNSGSISHVNMQNMSDPVPAPRIIIDEESTLLAGRRRQRRRRWLPSCCTRLSVCNFIFLTAAVIVILMALTSFSVDLNDSNGTNGPNGQHGQPPSPIGGGDGRKTPSSPIAHPAIPTPSITPTKECPYAYYSDTITFDFPNLSNFSFTEFMESGYITGFITGTIVVSSQKTQDVDMKIWYTYASTRPIVGSSSFQKTESSLSLTTPDLEEERQISGIRPCLYAAVHISIRPGVRLDNWDLVTANLDIDVQDGLFASGTEEVASEHSMFQVTGHSAFNVIRGKANIAYWLSRETEIEVISGSIIGRFALCNLLSLRTQSGLINIDIDPKKSDPDFPRPAEFIASSVSGNVRVRFPTEGDIPKREYRTLVSGMSSTLEGNYILGAVTTLHTTSGDIHADLLPYFNRKEPSRFSTETRSGLTILNILAPYDASGEPWRAWSTHKSTTSSGSIDVFYPQEWEGKIKCDSISGGIEVEGKDIIISEDDKFGSARHLIAKKGQSDARIGLTSMSGSIHLRVGEVYEV